MQILDTLREWWPLISVLATLGSLIAMLAVGWCLYQLHKRFVSKSELEAMMLVQAKHAGRLDALERRMESVPDGKDMQHLQLSIEEIRGGLKAQNDKIEAKMDGLYQVMHVLKEHIGLLVQSHLPGQ